MFSQTAPKPSILIVDDEPPIRQLLCDILSDRYICTTAGSAEEALGAVRSQPFTVVITDINLGGMSGVELIPAVHEVSQDTVVMMISGNLTMDSPIVALRQGAFDYVQKPFDFDYVTAAVERAVQHHDLLVAKRRHDEELEQLVEERTAQLNFLTYHDALTRLPNRSLLEDRLGQMIVNREPEERNAVMLVALDRLRTIRETLGADAADRIAQNTAERIIDTVGPHVTLGRIEADVFAILLPDTSPEQCVDLGGKLAAALTHAYELSGNELFLHSKIGVSLHPNDGESAEVLMRNAAASLAQARETSGSSFEFYAEGIKEFAAERLALENDFRRAIEHGELSVHYQPKVSFESGKIVGMEALARWQHPTRGMVRPDVFIKLAEEIGIIDPISEWITRSACEQTADWRDDGFKLELAVNLSGLQLQEKGCSERIVKLLDEVGFDPSCLNVEVTETVLMQNVALSIDELKRLRARGVKVSIDDFGTGYSSLNAFKRLPIDVLKIDRSFVSDLAEKPLDAAFVKTIIDLAHLLKVKIVAEGVETDQQLEILRDLGCDEWQGYLFSKPVPYDEFTELLRHTRHG
jgi:diguanylate cyclase (GGDEF)-like protein